MQLGTSLFLIAVGAILTFAVNASISGLDIAVVGWILMAVGAIGFVLSLFFLSQRRTTVVERPVVTDRREYY